MTLDLKKEYALDKERVEQGVEVPFGEDAYVKIRHVSSEIFQKVYESLDRATKRQIDSNRLRGERGKAVMADIIMRGAVADFGGFNDGGKAVKTNDQFKAVLMKYDSFRGELWDIASDDRLFGLAEFEEDAKN